MAVDVRREAARALFARLERDLRQDEVLADKQCVRMIIEKAQAEHTASSRKRFDPEAVFRNRLLYSKIDDVLSDWCRRREIRTDPYNVFRYEGSERGPTQHQTAIGPSLSFVNRAFDRLAEAVPELPDCRRRVLRAPTKAIAPAFRLQHPLPFGAAGETKYGGERSDLERGIYQAAMYAATTGDPARGWRYDCAVFVFYTADSPRRIVGDDLFDAWEDVRERVWRAARTWVILL